MRTRLPLPARVKNLKPYASARSVLKGNDWILLDANESPCAPRVPRCTSLLNRYPDPTADTLRDAIAATYGVGRENLIVGNGSDELIDLAVRSFVRRGKSVVSFAPTYGMYRVSADMNGCRYATVPLAQDGTLDAALLLDRAADADTMFLCNPNNPTGSTLPLSAIEKILDAFPGLVILDEAYGEFADAISLPSAISLVRGGRNNLLVLRTFSKTFAAAGMRLGYGIASKEIIDTLLKVKPPYNVNVLTQEIGLKLWNDRDRMKRNVRNLIAERKRLMTTFAKLGCRIFPSVTNFFLIDLLRGKNPEVIYARLRDDYRIVLRLISWGKRTLLRISVGTRQENTLLLSAISSLL